MFCLLIFCTETVPFSDSGLRRDRRVSGRVFRLNLEKMKWLNKQGPVFGCSDLPASDAEHDAEVPRVSPVALAAVRELCGVCGPKRAQARHTPTHRTSQVTRHIAPGHPAHASNGLAVAHQSLNRYRCRYRSGSGSGTGPPVRSTGPVHRSVRHPPEAELTTVNHASEQNKHASDVAWVEKRVTLQRWHHARAVASWRRLQCLLPEGRR